MESTVALIPVRGNSKSIPHKNIKSFCGEPLIYWTAKAATDCTWIEQVYVSTDSEEIKDVVTSFDMQGLQVVNRSSNTATDTASTESVMMEFAQNSTFSHIILIQATNPLLQSKDLEYGFQKYIKGKYDSLLSVVRQKRFIWNEEDRCAYPQNYKPNARPRRQDMDGYLVENGAFYITSRDALMKTKCRISGTTGVYEMPEDTYFEIDEPSDWAILEAIFNNRIKTES